MSSEGRVWRLWMTSDTSTSQHDGLLPPSSYPSIRGFSWPRGQSATIPTRCIESVTIFLVNHIKPKHQENHSWTATSKSTGAVCSLLVVWDCDPCVYRNQSNQFRNRCAQYQRYHYLGRTKISSIPSCLQQEFHIVQLEYSRRPSPALFWKACCRQCQLFRIHET